MNFPISNWLKLTLLLSFSTVSVYVSFAQLKIEIKPEHQIEINQNLSFVQHHSELGNIQKVNHHLNKVAFIYWESGALNEAIAYFLQMIPLNEKANNSENLKAIYGNIGLIKVDLGEYDVSLIYFDKSLEISRKANRVNDISATLTDIGYIQGLLGQHNEAIKNLEEAHQLLSNLNNPNLNLYCWRLLEYNYSRIGNTAAANDVNLKFKNFKNTFSRIGIDDFQQVEAANNIISNKFYVDSLVSSYQGEIKTLLSRASIDSTSMSMLKKQHEFLNNETKILSKTFRLLTVFFTIACLLLLLFLVLIYKNIRTKNKVKKLLADISFENRKKQEKLEILSNEMNRNIGFAKGIQRLLIQSQLGFNSYYSDSFIYFSPRNDISGDFFWHKPLHHSNEEFNPSKHKMLIATIDTTGVDIAGAFLCIACVDKLSEIVGRGVEKPNEVLTEFRSEIKSIFKQLYPNSSESISISICLIDPVNKCIDFAGAKSQIAYVLDGQLSRIKGNKEQINSIDVGRNVSYDCHRISYTNSLWLYMYSDGFMNQIGGEGAQKFSLKYFKVLIESITNFSPIEQRDVLIKTFHDWKKDSYPQVDDILVIGIKVGESVTQNNQQSTTNNEQPTMNNQQ